MKIPDNLKSFLSDSTVYTFINLLNKIIPFVLLPIIIRMVSTEDFGIYSIFITLESLLIPIVTLNMPAALSSHYYLDSINLREYLSTIVFSLLMACTIFLCIVLIIPESLTNKTGLSAHYVGIAVLTASAMGIINMLSNFYRLQRKPWYYGIFSIGQSFVLLSLIILFCSIKGNFIMLTIGRITYMAIFTIISIFLLYNSKLLTFKFNKEWFKRILKFSIPTVIYSVSAFIFLSSDRFLIKHFLGVEQVGYYAAIFQLASIMSILGASVNAAWMPWLFENLKKNDEKTKLFIVKLSYTLIACFLLFGFIFCIAYPFIAKFILPANYHPYINIAYPIIMGSVFEAIYLIVSPYTFYVEKTKYNGFIGSVIAILNVSLNLFLIPIIGLNGAAYSFLTSWVLLALMFFVFSTHVYPMPWINVFRKIKR
jgi:O-antigen/teichoic acid export membrane protein